MSRAFAGRLGAFVKRGHKARFSLRLLQVKPCSDCGAKDTQKLVFLLG